MTAADHANTGVDIIAVAKKFAPEVVYLRLVELEAERDALVAQAEAAVSLEDYKVVEGFWLAARERAEAAEAERDRLRQLVQGGNCIRDEHGMSPCESLRADNTRLREALEKIAVLTPFNTPDSSASVLQGPAIARAALATDRTEDGS